MCQIIFRTVDNGNIDFLKNVRCYKRGDVVSVVEDSHVWGEAESKSVWVANGKDPALWPGGFFILRIPDMPVADAQYLLEETGTWVESVGVETDEENYVPAHWANDLSYKRRKNFVDFDQIYNSLNKPTQKALDAAGEYTATPGRVANVLKVKV